VTSNLRSFSGAFEGTRPSPLEEGSRTLRAATALPRPALRRCKHAAKRDLESHPPTGTPLAGDASIRPPFAAMAVGKQRWTARAEELRAKDPPSRRLLPQDDEGEGSLPHKASRAPLGVVDTSNGGLDTPAVLRNRPRPSFLRHPAKGNALPKAGMPSAPGNPRG